MSQPPPLLSAIVTVGSCRDRAQRVLHALCAQSVAESIEVIVVDLAAENSPRLHTAPQVRTIYLPRPRNEPYAHARGEGVRHATAPVVAFLEDHCFPARDWAQLLIEIHKGPWAAVGYGFVNANPKTYLSRASMIVDYGLWMHPASHGPANFLAGNNVSYKREILASFGDQISTVLAPDFNLQETLVKRGLPMFVESRALAAHQNFTRLSGLLHANHAYCRLLAANRADAQSWSRVRRIVYGCVTPLSAPTIKFLRLVQSLRGRLTLLPAVVAAVPIIGIVFCWAAIGESFGYLFGRGTAEQDFNLWELEAERVAHT